MEGTIKNEARVSFEPGKVKAEYEIFVKVNEGTKFTCYIPSFDLIYSANDDEQVKKRADIMVKSFINFYFKEDSPKNFYITLHKLGFRAPNHNLVMKEALNKKTVKAKFLNISEGVPAGYDKSMHQSKETELSVTC